MTRHLIAVTSLALAALAVAADANHIQPGKWRSTETVQEMTSTILSAEQVAARKAKPMVFESCITSPDLGTRLQGADKMGLCQGPGSIANGRIDIDRQCNSGPIKSARKLQGTYSPTHYEYTQETRMDSPQGKSVTKSRVVVERIGNC